MHKKIYLNLDDVKEDMLRVYKEKGACTFSIYSEFGKYDPQLFHKKLKYKFSDLQKALSIPSRNHNIPKEALVEDVLKVYQFFGYINKDLYIKEGKFSRKPIDRLFGSWNNLLLELKLPINCLINIPEENLLNDLIRIYNDYGNITFNLVQEFGEYSSEVYSRRFGSFNNAVRRAGLQPNEKWLSCQTSISADTCIKIISQILNEIPIKEAQFEWLIYQRPLKIDAYFPMHNLALEYNGIMHYPEEMPDSSIYKTKSIAQQLRDIEKYKLLEEHNVRLLKIKYNEPLKIEYLSMRVNEILSNK